MTLTGKSVTSDEGQEEVPLFVEPEPMPFGLSDTARILGAGFSVTVAYRHVFSGCMMINIPFHLIGTKIASYPLLSRETPSRLPRGLDVLQRTSGPLIGASAFCWVVVKSKYCIFLNSDCTLDVWNSALNRQLSRSLSLCWKEGNYRAGCE